MFSREHKMEQVMNMVLSKASPDFLPADPVQQLVLATILTLACVFLGRILANTVGVGKSPPIFEGMPFVGGLLKFTRVSA